jgi:membrane associated rhomboid family serine protease
MSVFRDLQSAAKNNAAPVTLALVAALIAAFVLMWTGVATAAIASFAFFPQIALSRPWTFLTYEFVVGAAGPVGLLFSCLWLWSIGGSIERDLGRVKYLAVWFIFSALSALAVWAGSFAFHGIGAVLAGPWPSLAALTVLWGTRNPNVSILFMFVIPITGKWLAWISAAMLFFSTSPQLAPFAALPLILAYAFAAEKIPFAPYATGRYGGSKAGAKHERYDKKYYEEVQRREKDRAERERLRKLFEGSVNEDPEKGP